MRQLEFLISREYAEDIIIEEQLLTMSCGFYHIIDVSKGRMTLLWAPGNQQFLLQFETLL